MRQVWAVLFVVVVAVAVVAVVGCGGAAKNPPIKSEVEPKKVPPSASITETAETTTPPVVVAQKKEDDLLLTPDEGNTLPDKSTTIVIRSERSCFEILPSKSGGSKCTEMQRGAIEMVDDRWGITLDDAGKWRARELHPKTHTIVGRNPTNLELGDHAVFGDWDVQWIAVRFHVGRRSAVLRGRHRNQITAERPLADTAGIKSELDVPSHNRLFRLNVSLVSISNEPARPGGSITIIALQSDYSVGATFGQGLKPGVYTFSDGLRVNFENKTECDFDTSVPCIAKFEVEARLDQNDGHLALSGKKRTGKLLGHTFEINDLWQLVVRNK
jgi:hypothetical protein